MMRKGRRIFCDDDLYGNLMKKKKTFTGDMLPHTPVLSTWEDPTTNINEPLSPYAYLKWYIPQERVELMTTMTNVFSF